MDLFSEGVQDSFDDRFDVDRNGVLDPVEQGYKLEYLKREREMSEEEVDPSVKTIYLAGGCFWGTQKFFDQFDGIVETRVGYANGASADPTYEEVCNDSGHAETVRIDYDEGIISTEEILKYYFMVIDPTSINRQGGDTGIQYRTGIYYEDESLLPVISAVMDEEQKKYDQPLAVEVLPLENFYTAEEYHQKYLDKNPDGYCHINPALLRLKKK